MTLNIRPAGPADLPALAELAAQTFPDAAPESIPRSSVHAFIRQNLTEKNFRTYLNSKQWHLLVADHRGKLVGYSLVGTDTSHNPPEAPNAAYLSKFYLAAEARGTGAATQMMHRVFEFAYQLGFTSMWLGTAKENHRANGFYTKAGFEIVGERAFELEPGVFGEDYVRLAQLPAHPVGLKE